MKRWLPAAALAVLLAGCGERKPPVAAGAPDAGRGRIALSQYGCQSCHMIPGVTGPRVHVGPPLEDMGARTFIAGSIPNTRANLERWIMDPRQLDHRTAMPDLDVTARDAADMAAYLLEH